MREKLASMENRNTAVSYRFGSLFSPLNATGQNKIPASVEE